MTKGKGKAKGSRFEREYAKKISLWLTNDKSSETVWRSSNSGGRATVNNSKKFSGDLVSLSEESKPFFDIFSIELKNYNKIDMLDFTKKNFLLYQWWDQASEDAKRSNKIPLLIYRIGRKGDWLVLTKEIFLLLVKLEIIENASALTYLISNNGLICFNAERKQDYIILPISFLFENFKLDKIILDMTKKI